MSFILRYMISISNSCIFTSYLHYVHLGQLKSNDLVAVLFSVLFYEQRMRGITRDDTICTRCLFMCRVFLTV